MKPSKKLASIIRSNPAFQRLWNMMAEGPKIVTRKRKMPKKSGKTLKYKRQVPFKRK